MFLIQKMYLVILLFYLRLDLDSQQVQIKAALMVVIFNTNNPVDH